MESAKINIRKVVDEYIRTNRQEYEDFKTQMRVFRHSLADSKYGTSADKEGLRALFETPINLHESIVNNLTIDQLEWFKSKDGGRWFATTFPTFRIPEHV